MELSDSAHLQGIRGLLSEIVENYQAIIGDRLYELILFGSYAKGCQEKYSDLDILALVNDTEEQIRKYDKKLEDINHDLTLRHEILISCIITRSSLFNEYKDALPFYMNVEKEGILIYERSAA
ncbi:MAG: nucleotidyltransferase domain-containing protein [Candidatus Eremiobacteraeota bacterium]|nr:nucleotidyltransferase domain-containing protein [Candidatus Eremiobacteraeota bacterium]